MSGALFRGPGDGSDRDCAVRREQRERAEKEREREGLQAAETSCGTLAATDWWKVAIVTELLTLAAAAPFFSRTQRLSLPDHDPNVI